MKKDLTKKVMTKCKDVFSDICNVNLFDGRQAICSEDLEVEESNIVYQDRAGVFREHRMDVRMKHKVSNAEIALYCLGNQSEVSNIMPVRDMGYLFNKQEINMCIMMDMVEERGMQKGMEKGMESIKGCSAPESVFEGVWYIARRRCRATIESISFL